MGNHNIKNAKYKALLEWLWLTRLQDLRIKKSFHLRLCSFSKTKKEINQNYNDDIFENSLNTIIIPLSILKIPNWKESWTDCDWKSKISSDTPEPWNKYGSRRSPRPVTSSTCLRKSWATSAKESEKRSIRKRDRRVREFSWEWRTCA